MYLIYCQPLTRVQQAPAPGGGSRAHILSLLKLGVFRNLHVLLWKRRSNTEGGYEFRSFKMEH